MARPANPHTRPHAAADFVIYTDCTVGILVDHGSIIHLEEPLLLRIGNRVAHLACRIRTIKRNHNELAHHSLLA